MNDITQQSYTKEITDLAYDIATELLDEHDSREEAEEAAYDRIHETVDGHEWVIYTYQAGLVPDFSSNYDAYRDCYCNEDIGAIVSEKGLDAVKPVIAYFAMTQDISEQMEQAFDAVEGE